MRRMERSFFFYDRHEDAYAEDFPESSFGPDLLHLNVNGYEHWNKCLSTRKGIEVLSSTPRTDLKEHKKKRGRFDYMEDQQM